jgi:hypothetical protein
MVQWAAVAEKDLASDLRDTKQKVSSPTSFMETLEGRKGTDSRLVVPIVDPLPLPLCKHGKITHLKHDQARSNPNTFGTSQSRHRVARLISFRRETLARRKDT